MKLCEMTDTGEGMNPLHFESKPVDIQIRISLEIQILIPHHFWSRRPKFKWSDTPGVGTRALSSFVHIISAIIIQATLLWQVLHFVVSCTDPACVWSCVRQCIISTPVCLVFQSHCTVRPLCPLHFPDCVLSTVPEQYRRCLDSEAVDAVLLCSHKSTVKFTILSWRPQRILF